jgi:tRNA threonylcarbamoyladenosine biosynthesis protein TsaE
MNSERLIKKEELPALAAEVLMHARQAASAGATVLALQGDLGAGKTTFVQALGTVLGVSEQITSPTFTIMKVYETTDETFTRLVHMDAYRIEDIAELPPLRFTDILATPKTLFCIEWPEKIAEALSSDILKLSLAIVDEFSRTATFSLIE